MRSSRALLAVLLVLMLIMADGRKATAQLQDQIVVFGIDNSFLNQVARFDRRLNLLGMTQTTFAGAGAGTLDHLEPMAADGLGRYLVPFDALNDTKVLRMSADGTLLLPSLDLPYNPVAVATAASGSTYVLTRIPLLSPAPLQILSSEGSILASNAAGPALFVTYPQRVEVTPFGNVWIPGSKHAFPGWLTQLVQVHPATGEVIDQLIYPIPAGGSPSENFAFWSLAAAPDGSLWGFVKTYITHIDAQHQVIQQAATNCYGDTICLDAHGNYLAKRIDKPAPWQTEKITLFDGETLAVLADYKVGGATTMSGGGFALGATGEELFVSGGDNIPPDFPRRLWKFNLVTGTRSSIGLADLGIDWDIPLGDPTGFVWANVRDQNGDADGDGAPNRAETLAGSNPFDATSRPEGPKIYISFEPGTNAIVLTAKDPDGIFDDNGGLKIPSLSITASGYGEVLPYLWPAVTKVELDSAFVQEAKVTFGALPLPLDLKIALEAHVEDKTGATAWDWHVTPPGDL